EILKDVTTIDDVFFQRRERDRSTTFFQSPLFVSQASIYHGEDAKRRPVVRLRLHNLFLLRASCFKSSVRGVPRPSTRRSRPALLPARSAKRCSLVAINVATAMYHIANVNTNLKL